MPNAHLQTFVSTNEVHEIMKVDHKCIEFLQHIDFQARLKINYPGMVASFGKELGQIDLTGPAAQVEDTLVVICEQISTISERQLTVPESELVYNIVVKERWDEYFTKQLSKENIKAKVCVGPGHSVSILASSQNECEKAFEILFEILVEKIISRVSKDCCLQSFEFQLLISKLELGRLIQIVPNIEESSIRIFGIDEEISRATKEISDFITDKVDRIRSVTYKPCVTTSVWKFLALHTDDSIFEQIERDLEQFFVSIKITDGHEQFLLHGSSEGIEQCKQRLSEIAATVVETQKMLEYPGVQKLFRDQDSKERLQKIEKEMCVKIEIEMLPVQPQRSLSLSSVKNPKTSIYDVCNFTTEEGITVSWKYGRIENEQADVLVNSANSNLNNHTACGKALMIRGGPCYKEACKPHTDVQPGDIVVTQSGDLLSNYVIHAVFCDLLIFKDRVIPAQEFLQELLRKILEKCQELGASSLAMPVIGTGKEHGFPEEAILKVARNEIKFFSSNNSHRLTLKDIRVIVLRSEIKKKRSQSVHLPSRQRISALSALDQERPTETTSSTEVKIAFGPVRIFLSGGNFIQYEADGLVVLHSKDKKTGVAQSHDEKIFAESTPKQRVKIPLGTVMVIEAGHDSNIKRSIHCFPVSPDVSGLERAVKACLDAAKFFELHNILILAKEVASFGVTANECAEVILKASEIFSNVNYEIDIEVVVSSAGMKHVFKVAFEETAKKQAKNVEATENDQSVGVKDAVFKQKCYGDKQKVRIHVVGFQHNVDQSIEEIEAYVSKNKVRKSIKSKKLVEKFQKYEADIKELTKRFEVLLTLSDHDVFIDGTKEQVLECKELLIDFLDKEREVKRFREISESVQWSYSDENGVVMFDDILNGMLENELRDGKEKFTIPETEYNVNLRDKIILDNNSGRTAQLSRKHVQRKTLDLPGVWEPQPKEQDVHLVTLSSSSLEYRKVIELLDGGKDLMIVRSIERIQNPRLYKLYRAKKESMGMEPNEKQLFHGTKMENVPSINTNNFNRRFAGINGTRLGHGVYFSRDALYSLRFSEKDSEEKEGPFHMYVAKVLVGKSVKGERRMRVLPKRNDPLNPELWYDSAVDDTEDPSIFVTFDDHQCYPEYLITFTTASGR